MEIETNNLLKYKFKYNSLKFCIKKYLYYFIYIFLVINFIIFISFFNNFALIKKNNLLLFEFINKLQKKIIKNENKISNLNSILKNYSKLMINAYNKINEKNFKEKYIFESEMKEINNFCNNPKLFSNIEYDKNIKITNVIYKNLKFNMYVYKKGDSVSNSIINFKNFEVAPTNNILKALTYFSIKNKIDNNNIYIIDIGANIGWYSLILSKLGYKILSFEPSKLNYYILKKNYCLNKGLNITLINKGLYNEEKKCDLYNFKGNKGNAIIKCNNNLTVTREMIKEGEIILTKLNNYLPFIKEKNLLLIKIDVEGAEGKAFEGGILLISQYHVPFIFMEFTPSFLKSHGTDPIRFLQIFINNEYKISPKHFLDKKDYKIDNIIKIAGIQINLYITYKKVFEG